MNQTVAAKCPICSAVVPMFTVTITVRGWLRPKASMEVTADASDYVAHMWTHTDKEQTWV